MQRHDVVEHGGPMATETSSTRMTSPRTGPLEGSLACRLADPMTRRHFLVRAAALGASASALGAVLEACAQVARPSATPSATPSGTPGATPSPSPSPSPVITPGPAFGGTPPVIDPLPASATYGAMLEASALAPIAVPSAALRALLDEVAAEARIPVAPGVVDGHRQARLSVTADDPSFADQAYRLEVTPAADGPAVTVRAGDEAGAYYGLLSLARLVVAEGPTTWLRTATVEDAPGFGSRGAILDQFAWPDLGATDASRARMLERIRLAARYKLNYLSIPPWPDIVCFCDDHHVELMVAVGFRDRPTVTPMQQMKDQIDARLEAGIRSISITTDEDFVSDPKALGRLHAAMFVELIDYIRNRDPGVRVSILLPVYGGIPGKHLVNAPAGNGERYLAMIRAALPSDVPTFWTGDGGVFSPTMTAAGARAFSEAVGRSLIFWDNDTIKFSRAEAVERARARPGRDRERLRGQPQLQRSGLARHERRVRAPDSPVLHLEPGRLRPGRGRRRRRADRCDLIDEVPPSEKP
jgi:hypothetical protein